jgi:hypothetical protein
MDHAHEIDIDHPPEQRSIRFSERPRFRNAGIGDQDIYFRPRARLRHCGLDLGLVGHIRYHGEICATCGNNGIERCAMTAEHGDGCARSFQDRRNLPADASTATSDERMRGMRQSDQAQPPSNAFSAYILYFKLLQQIT